MTDLYRKVGWPEIQDYMDRPDYPEECYFDPNKDCWFIPEDWEPDNLGLGGEIGDLEDALG